MSTIEIALEIGYALFAGLCFPLGVEFTLRTGICRHYEIIRPVWIPTILWTFCFVFACLGILNAGWFIWSSEGTLAGWATVGAYLLGAVTFGFRAISARRRLKRAPNQSALPTPV